MSCRTKALKVSRTSDATQPMQDRQCHAASPFAGVRWTRKCAMAASMSKARCMQPSCNVLAGNVMPSSCHAKTTCKSNTTRAGVQCGVVKMLMLAHCLPFMLCYCRLPCMHKRTSSTATSSKDFTRSVSSTRACVASGMVRCFSSSMPCSTLHITHRTHSSRQLVAARHHHASADCYALFILTPVVQIQ